MSGSTSAAPYAGPVRHPRNLYAGSAGSIHDDATATRLGFRGGTVAGSVHLDQFPPLLLRAFGERWFETGSVSVYFRNATTDGEPVQAFVAVPADRVSDQQVRVWMTQPDETLVAEPPHTEVVRAESEANGKIVEKVVSLFLDPTDFSTMK